MVYWRFLLLLVEFTFSALNSNCVRMHEWFTETNILYVNTRHGEKDKSRDLHVFSVKDDIELLHFNVSGDSFFLAFLITTMCLIGVISNRTCTIKNALVITTYSTMGHQIS